MNPYSQEIKERFYFSYSPEESEYLKRKGFFYITKAIHPRNNLIFCLFDKSDRLIASVKEFKEMGWEISN